MKKLLFFACVLSLSCGVCLAEYDDGRNIADNVRVDTGGFNGTLSILDDTVQKALEAIDGLLLGSLPGNSDDITEGDLHLFVSPEEKSIFSSQDANHVYAAPSGSAGKPLFRILTSADLPSAISAGSIGITIEGEGSVITTGSKGYIYVPFACTITSATLLADQAGSIVVDVKKCAYGSFPSTASITASAAPTLSSEQNSQDTTLTGWTTSVSAGDVIEFEVVSVATITRATLILKVTK